MKKLIMVAWVSFALDAAAQNSAKTNFLYLYSDSVVYANEIRLRRDLLNAPVLRVDGQRVPTSNVKFLKNDYGFFANTRRLTLGRENNFTERIIEGKINLYTQETYAVLERGYFASPYERHYAPAHSGADTRMHYNKGFGDLKRVNAVNLEIDMKDNAESLRLLGLYRRQSTTAKVIYGAAGAAVFGALVAFISNGRRMQAQVGSGFGSSGGFGYDGGMGSRTSNRSVTSGMGPTFALMGVAAGAAIGGYVIQNSSRRYLEDAFDAYNR